MKWQQSGEGSEQGWGVRGLQRERDRKNGEKKEKEFRPALKPRS